MSPSTEHHQRAHTVLRIAASDPSASLYLVGHDGEALEAEIIRADADNLRFTTKLPQTPATLTESMAARLVVYGAVFDARANVSPSVDGLIIELCDDLSPRTMRNSPRLSTTDKNIKLSWTDESGKPRSAKVADFSADGVSLDCSNPESSPPPPNQFAADLEMESGERISCIAAIVRGDDQNESFGVKLQPSDPNEHTLAEAYLQSRFARLQKRVSQAPGEVMRFMEDTGYLDLRDAGDIHPGWESNDAPPALTQDLVYRTDEGELLGHMSITRGYKRAWYAHQFATRSIHRDTAQCRSDLYKAAINWPRMMDRDAMLLAYFDQSKPWHRRNFADFVDWLDDTQQAAIVGFDRVETNGAALHIARPGLSVERATDDDMATAAAIILPSLSVLARDAFDITADTLRGDLLSQVPGTEGKRRRELLVVRDQGVVVGAGLCETGDKRLSLFNIFNSALCFFDESASNEARSMLFAKVQEYFRQLGVHKPLLLCPEGQASGRALGSFEVEEAMGCMIWSAEALRAYENFLDLQYGRYLARKSKAKSCKVG